MEETNSLMEVTQLPVIKERLETLGKEIDVRLKEVNQLAVTEETRKDVKKIRTEMRKEFDELEAQRKQIKQMVLEPYMQFEEIYKANVSDKYREADNQLKNKIDVVEQGLIQELYEETKAYFDEACDSKHLTPYAKWNNMGLKINLSTTFTSLKKQIDDKLNKIVNDINSIELEEFNDEILNEYLQCFDYAVAKLNVMNRKKRQAQLEEERLKRQAQIEQDNKIVETVDKVVENSGIVVEPVEEIKPTEETLYVVEFTVRGTREKIVALREYMNENNIEFTSL